MLAQSVYIQLFELLIDHIFAIIPFEIAYSKIFKKYFAVVYIALLGIFGNLMLYLIFW